MWDRHNGRSAKKRCLDSEAQRRKRETHTDINRTMSESHSDKKRPEPDQRREENSNTPIVPKGDENPEPPAEEKPETLLRAMALFRMRSATPLDRSSRRAWKLAAPAVAATSAAEWSRLEAYYAADLADKDDYRRQDLSTLLNNWSGELTKAARYCERQGLHPENSQKKETPPPPDDLWREVLHALYPDSDPSVYSTWSQVPDSLRTEILSAIQIAEKEAA
jgi:hypothetical protein